MKMLTGVNQRVEKTQRRLEKIDDRLKSMIAKKSKSFYYAVILIEIAVIILLIII